MSISKCFVSSKCPVSCSAAVSDWLIQTFLSPLLPQSICHQQLAEVKRNKQTATEELVKSFQVEGFGKSNHWNIDTYWLLVWRFTSYIRGDRRLKYGCFFGKISKRPWPPHLPPPVPFWKLHCAFFQNLRPTYTALKPTKSAMSFFGSEMTPLPLSALFQKNIHFWADGCP